MKTIKELKYKTKAIGYYMLSKVCRYSSDKYYYKFYAKKFWG